MQIQRYTLLCAALLALAACGKKPQTGTEPATHASRDQAASSAVGKQASNVAAPAADRKAKTAEKEGEGAEKEGEGAEKERKEAKHADSDEIRLTAAQISATGIEVMSVQQVSSDAIEAPAQIVADPTRAATVAAAVGGRIVAVHRNLGESVRQGEALALIESAEVAGLKAELEAAKSQRDLAETTLAREDRLFREKVSAEQDFLSARAAAAEARTRLRLAEQRLSAAGGNNEGQLNRLVIRAPMKGQIIMRRAVVGHVVEANSELFQIADLSEVSVEVSLRPDDARRARIGASVQVAGGDHAGTAKLAFISPVIDATTRQVVALAKLPNPKGEWRVGETVHAAVLLEKAKLAVAVPQQAIQTVEDKPSVFVRTAEGFEVKHVVLGPTKGNLVTVLSGLTGRESVAVKNSYVLKAELGKGEGGDDD